MGDENEAQPDYEQRLKKLADEGPMHKVDNEAGVVDITDQTGVEPDEPDPQEAFRFGHPE